VLVGERYLINKLPFGADDGENNNNNKINKVFLSTAGVTSRRRCFFRFVLARY